MLTPALLKRIDAWCKATGQPESLVGTIVLNHAGFASQLRKRGTLTAATGKRVAAFMDAYPDKDSLPFEIIQELKLEARSGRGWWPPVKPGVPVVEAAQLPAPPAALAVPAVGKPRIPAAVIRAATVDGRDLPRFVSALIVMGLECWRDDRAANGEAI